MKLILNSGTKASIEVAKWETEPLRGEQSKAPWLEGSHCHAQGSVEVRTAHENVRNRAQLRLLEEEGFRRKPRNGPKKVLKWKK